MRRKRKGWWRSRRQLKTQLRTAGRPYDGLEVPRAFRECGTNSKEHTGEQPVCNPNQGQVPSEVDLGVNDLNPEKNEDLGENDESEALYSEDSEENSLDKDYNDAKSQAQGFLHRVLQHHNLGGEGEGLFPEKGKLQRRRGGYRRTPYEGR